MFDHVILEPEQKELLIHIVEAARNTPKERRMKFMLINNLGGASLIHPGWKRKDVDVYEGDINVLANEGIINTSYGSKGTLSFDISPFGFKYYEHLKSELGQPLERAEETVNRYINGPGFIQKYPAAYKKWAEAESILWSTDSEEQLTTIGHLCREAVQEFATALVDRHKPVGVEPEITKTVSRIRSVLNTKTESLGTTVKPLMEALIAYWGTASDLIQRQEHGGQKKGKPLIWEDGRRVVFNSAIVMAEIDRALE